METPAPTPSQAFSSPTPPVPPSRRKFWLSVVLALLFLIGVSYYYLFYVRNTLAPTIQTPSSTSSSQSSTVNSANWKTYQSSKWALTFNYPDTWIIGQDSPDSVSVQSTSKINNDYVSWMVLSGGVGYCEGAVIKSTSKVTLGGGVVGDLTDCADPTSGTIGSVFVRYSLGKAGDFLITAHYTSYVSRAVIDEIIKSFKPTPS